MCMVCMVTQGYMDRFPLPIFFPPLEYVPFQKELETAREKDIIDGAPDCPSAEKLEWQRAVEKYMQGAK